ncbi:MAG: hypothetical protein ACLRFJ_01020 [Alphaproteobacteria bacterium]
MTDKENVLCDKFGKPITGFHGTYYDFDYFFPLSHFGTEATAKTELNEGKWKRDKNIDINKPKIISAHFKNGNYFEIPDLNNHYIEDWQAIILAFLLDKTIIEDIDNLHKWDDIKKKCKSAAAQKLPYNYDFISQSIDDIKTQQEISYESLYTIPNKENLFLQRMIRFFESVCIDGFVYKNFTECGGDNSYIVFRQNNVIRTDKKLPPMETQVNNEQLQQIEQDFMKSYIPHYLTNQEKENWIKQLHDFYDFRINQIAWQKHKLSYCNNQK